VKMIEELPHNTAELLSGIEREWTALLGVVERLSPEQMVTADSGGWSPKDNLAHLEAWLHFLNASYLGGQPAHEAWGIEAAAYARLDEDGVNAVLFKRNRDRTADDVLQGLRRAYAEALETIRARLFTDLLKLASQDDPERRTILQEILANTSEHFAQHRLTIEKAL
jgi:hypothetical protein